MKAKERAPMSTKPSKIARPNARSDVTSLAVTSAAPSPTVAPAYNSAASEGAAFIAPEQRRAMIAEAAYYKAERRGFESGCALNDWFAAESEIDAMLMRGDIPLACGT
jgi:hypothetical protein